MRLDKLIMKDFLTWDYLEYEFEDRPLSVQGLNLTDDNQETNGSGKSGLQTAIEFCITAQNSRGVRDVELPTFGKKSAELHLYASCNVRKQQLHIKWIINIKGSNKLFLETKSGDDVWLPVDFSTVDAGKKFILSWFI